MNQFARPGLGVTELPPVNADDNGKVLGVSDGAWAKVAASGGSDLPDDPAQDGTYNLQNTVSSGTGTLSWASGSSGGGVLVVGVTETEMPNGNIRLTLNKTWQEIHDADYPVLKQSNEDASSYMTVLGTSGFNVDYAISAYTGEVTLQFSCVSASGYPSTEIEP